MEEAHKDNCGRARRAPANVQDIKNCLASRMTVIFKLREFECKLQKLYRRPGCKRKSGFAFVRVFVPDDAVARIVTGCALPLL